MLFMRVVLPVLLFGGAVGCAGNTIDDIYDDKDRDTSDVHGELDWLG